MKMKTINLSEELQIKLINLLTLTDVCDTITAIDTDSDCEINVTEMINEIRTDILGQL